MKKLLWMAGVVGVGLVVRLDAAEQNNARIFKHHFAGKEALSKESGGTRAKEIWQMPETAALLEEAVSKLSSTPAMLWPKRLGTSKDQVSNLVKPLLQDLLNAESVSEISGPTNAAEAVVAIRLEPERASVWDTNLWQLTQLSGASGHKSIQVAEFAGWELAVGETRLLQVLRGKGWLAFAVGKRPLEAMNRMLRTIDREGGPKRDKDWFEVEADLTALGHWLPVFRRFQLPTVALALRGDGENLRTTGKFTFRNPLPWTFEPWKIPTNSIVEPIISFTAAQGIAPILLALFQGDTLGLAKMPNQFCMWGQPTDQRQLVVTFPIRDSTNAINILADKLPQRLTKIIGSAPRDFLYLSNRTMLGWGFLAPPAFPHLTPWEESGQEYLIASVLPVFRDTNPPPTELFAQLGTRQNLLYYDWEISEEKALFALQVYQLFAFKHGYDVAATEASAQRWIQAVRSHLGNTVTEITRSGPRELELERKSHLGLTGFELASLALWTVSSGFPLSFDRAPQATVEAPSNTSADTTPN